MFGVGDNNQGHQDQAGPALPPSPFMEPSAGAPPDQPAMQHPGAVDPVAVAPSHTPLNDNVVAPPLDNEAEPTPSPAHISPSDDLLVGIKQQALSSLTPLVGHLDQTPEERFKTTMMLIQASDNADLVKDAYEAASHITDEKERAQALLDVVNEINYFTQKDATDKKV